VAAARESLLLPGLVPGRAERRKAWRTGVIAAIIIILLLAGGKKWWSIDEKAFREGLRAGAWPDLLADVRVEGSRRILRLTLGKKEFGPEQSIALVPDHGKLLHLFVIRQPDHDAFGHLHPVRTGNQVFEVGLPPLPEGEYAVFCDLTFENSGFSSTATNSVHIPALLKATADQVSPAPDADDSWASSEVKVVRAGTNDAVCRLPTGQQVVWKAHSPLRARQDAWLRFEVRDAAGKSIELEPYMGMMSHVAVLRSDGGVFAHLHPSGNYSMAAQSFFDAKMERETGKVSDAGMPAAMDHSRMHHQPANGAAPVISLPYEFPTAGNYRIWVQFKTDGQVLTGVFDATVAGE